MTWENILKQNKLTTECSVMSKDSEKYKSQDGQRCFVTWSLDVDKSRESIKLAIEVHKVEFKDGFEPLEFTGLGEEYLIDISGAGSHFLKNILYGDLGSLAPESVSIDDNYDEPMITFEFYK